MTTTIEQDPTRARTTVAIIADFDPDASRLN